MKFAAVAAFVLLAGAGPVAQQHPHAPAPPPVILGPQVLSTQGRTVLPPPPPPSPFAARPDTYAPHYDRPFRAGAGRGVSIYNGTLGLIPYTLPAAPPAVPDQKPAASVPPPAPEPPKAAPAPEPVPVPEPPRIAAVHGPDLFYVIAGCYAGNRPPIPERLPKGCDPAKMRTTPIR